MQMRRTEMIAERKLMSTLATGERQNPTKNPTEKFREMWPSAMIGCGVALSLAWTCFLAYELFSLIESVL